MKNINERPNERSVYIWNISGSIANALLSVVALMIVTRVLDDRQADIFSIAWTISLLMATVGTFQLRMYQATDVTGIFLFRQYWIFRLLTVGIMLISSLVYVIIRGYTGEKALVVLLICVFRAVDSLADVYEGWFQQKERLDLAGKALTYRIVVAVIGFGVGLVFTKDLILSSVILVIAYVVCFFVYDIRYNRKVVIFREKKWDERLGLRWIGKMTAEGFPLFVNAFLMMSIMNAPKMVLDVAIDQGDLAQGVQTIFNIIFMPASFLNLAYIVFRPLITRMALMWNAGKIKSFLEILLKIGVALLGIAIVIFVGSLFLGIPILSLVYAIDLSEYKRHLLIIIIGGCVYTFAAVLDNALVVIRKQYVLILSYTMTYLYIQVAARYMVGSYGAWGGALAYTTAMMVFFVVTAVLFAICLKMVGKRDEK